jgi:hypothetical protein
LIAHGFYRLEALSLDVGRMIKVFQNVTMAEMIYLILENTPGKITPSKKNS